MAKKKESRWSSIRKESTELVLSSTIHGFPNIFKRERTTLKTLWLFLSITSLIGCQVTVYQNISSYLRYNVISETKTVSDQPFIFPAITFCIDFPFDLIGMTKFCAFKYNYSDCKDRLNVSMFDSFQELDYFGRYNCIRFNGFKNENIQLKSSIGTSFMNGFQIEFLMPHNWLGIHVYVADNHVNYFEPLMPFYAGTSNEIQLYFRKMVEKLMPYPYNPCFSINRKSHLQENCIQKCIHEKVAETYNCSFPGYYMINRKVTCNDDYYNQFQYFEFLNKRNLFKPNCKRKCAKECETTRYETTILHQPLKWTHPERDQTIRVITFFAESIYQEIVQVPQMTLSGLISSLGGTIGVFLGLSFLSFVEIIEFFIRIFFIMFKKSN